MGFLLFFFSEGMLLVFVICEIKIGWVLCVMILEKKNIFCIKYFGVYLMDCIKCKLFYDFMLCLER